MTFTKKFVLLLILGTMACIDAEYSQVLAYGDGGKVTCYSGGTVVYEGTATGKVLTEDGSDGWYFRESGSGALIRTNADCIIRN